MAKTPMMSCLLSCALFLGAGSQPASAQGRELEEILPLIDATLVIQRWEHVGGGAPSGRFVQEFQCRFQADSVEALLLEAEHFRRGCGENTRSCRIIHLDDSLRQTIGAVLSNPRTFRLVARPEYGHERHFDGGHGIGYFIRNGTHLLVTDANLGCSAGFRPGPEAEALEGIIARVEKCAWLAATHDGSFLQEFIPLCRLPYVPGTDAASCDVSVRFRSQRHMADYLYWSQRDSRRDWVRDWLVAALHRHGLARLVYELDGPTVGPRIAVIEILRAQYGTDLGFVADAPREVRREAISRWEVLAYEEEVRMRRADAVRKRREALPPVPAWKWEYLQLVAEDAGDASTRQRIEALVTDYGERYPEETALVRTRLP